MKSTRYRHPDELFGEFDQPPTVWDRLGNWFFDRVDRIVDPAPGSKPHRDVIIFDVFGPIYTYSPIGDMEETFDILGSAVKKNIDDVVRYISEREPELVSKGPESTPFQCVAEEWLLQHGKVPVYANLGSIATIDYSKRVGIETVLFSSGTMHSMEMTIPAIVKEYNALSDKPSMDYADLRAIVSLHGTGMTKKEDKTWDWFRALDGVRAGRKVTTVVGIFDDNIEHLKKGVRKMNGKNFGWTATIGYHCEAEGRELNLNDVNTEPGIPIVHGYIGVLAFNYIRDIEHARESRGITPNSYTTSDNFFRVIGDLAAMEPRPPIQVRIY